MDSDSFTRNTIERRRAQRWQLAQAELIDEILGAGKRISEATTPDGVPIVRTDPLWRFLRAVQRANYCCSISDVARLIRVSRQRAQRLAHKAQLAGAIELVPNSDDDRIVQILLTPRTRAELARATRDERVWADKLLLGLNLEPMLTATRVLRVIRERLARDERERREVRR